MPSSTPPEDPLALAVGRAIRARREELGESRTQLGAKADISEQSIALYETGKRLPPMPVLVRMAAALDIVLAELVKEMVA